jgi:hypothetical protein
VVSSIPCARGRCRGNHCDLNRHPSWSFLSSLGSWRKVCHWLRQVTLIKFNFGSLCEIILEPGYGLDDRGFESWQGLGIFLFTITSRTALRPSQPPIQWVPGDLSLRVKWPEGKTDHSPPSSAEVKNAWRYTSTPQYVFMSWCLVKHRDNFTLLYFYFC